MSNRKISVDRLQKLSARIASLPRVPLVDLPTPLYECSRFSAALGGPRILIKRDDLTGLAFGGSKSRMLELILGNAKAKGAGVIVNKEYTQSNLDRQLAAAAAKSGIEFHFVVEEDPVKGTQIQGNFLLTFLLGAKIHYLAKEKEEASLHTIESLVEALRQEGRKVYVISNIDRVLGAISYVGCVLELYNQSKVLGFCLDYIVCSCHAATHAGLVLGCKVLDINTRVIGFRAFQGQDQEVSNRVSELANEAAAMLEIDVHITPEDIFNNGRYAGEYRVMTEACLDAIQKLARTEGILADPVYVGKALAGLMDYIRQGKIDSNKSVVFVHTGGTPTLFSYADDIVRLGDYNV